MRNFYVAHSSADSPVSATKNIWSSASRRIPRQAANQKVLFVGEPPSSERHRDQRRTVLVFRSRPLAHSETFIKEQILAYREWRPILIGRRPTIGLSLDDLNVRFLEEKRPALSDKIRSTLWRRLGWPTLRLDALEHEGPRLLHAHFGPDGVLAAPIASALKIPLVVTLHGYDINIYREWWEAGHAGKFMRGYPRRLLRLAEQPFVHFVAVSDAIRHRAIEFGIPAAKVTVCHIGINRKMFFPSGTPISARRPRVLFVGRLIENKGCRYLIEAMASAQRSVSEAKLIVIGDGPSRSNLEELAKRLDVNVEFRGLQPSTEVKRELDEARLLCLPCITIESGASEGLGMVLLEAQASGVPVLTSARDGRSEAVADGITGFAFRERDTEALKMGLMTLLTDDPTAMRMAEAAPHFVRKHFDIDTCTTHLEALYGRLSGSQELEGFRLAANTTP